MVRNLETVLAKLGRIPARVKAAADEQLRLEAEQLVQAIKQAAPVASPAPGVVAGAVRDSVHFYQNPSRELSLRIVADAKDRYGHGIAKHVEFGHRAANGEHVQAQPFFYPTYRARKRGMKRRVAAASMRAAKAEFPG